MRVRKLSFSQIDLITVREQALNCWSEHVQHWAELRTHALISKVLEMVIFMVSDAFWRKFERDLILKVFFRKYLNRNDESKCNNSQIDSANSSQCVEISHTHRSSNADEEIFAITAYGDGTRDNASAGNGSYWNNLKDILAVQLVQKAYQHSFSV